ncbi:MAG: glycogen debranching protein [Micromonosporaceae bacterium]|nr:glycogen debranching protein [Micromonosporaceae bacterium]
MAAAKVLRANDRGAITVAAPALYPHQWSWDAAFITVGLAHLSTSRACAELESLLAGQWRTGMIPHIVFSDDAEAPYFPGPEWWRAHELAEAAPRTPRTSGICQPPVHAIGLERILKVAASRGDDVEVAVACARRLWPKLYDWHRWLIDARSDRASGLIAIVHSWESGLDNSPRWDQPYRAVPKGPLPPYRRRDIGVVSDESQRPSNTEYNRYLWLVEELKHASYEDAEIARRGSFRVGDVFFSAILAVACDVLADIADVAGVSRSEPRGAAGPEPGAAVGADPREVVRPGPREVADLRRWAGELRAAVAATVDRHTCLARDYDVRAGRWVVSDTIAGFAPLICGGQARAEEAAMLAVFDGPAWAGHPDLVVPAPPSTSLRSEALDRRRYWRGPLWPVMLWWYGWALERRGHADHAARLADAGMRLVSDGQFAEYYEPVTGEALGSADQSWTAAVTLDWLASTRSAG